MNAPSRRPSVNRNQSLAELCPVGIRTVVAPNPIPTPDEQSFSRHPGQTTLLHDEALSPTALNRPLHALLLTPNRMLLHHHLILGVDEFSAVTLGRVDPKIESDGRSWSAIETDRTVRGDSQHVAASPSRKPRLMCPLVRPFRDRQMHRRPCPCHLVSIPTQGRPGGRSTQQRAQRPSSRRTVPVPASL